MKSRKLSLIVFSAFLTALASSAQEPRGAIQEHRHYRVTDLGTLGGTFSDALGINNKRWIVGDSTLPGDTVLRAFLWRNGVKTDLGTLGGPNSTNSSVSDRGEIVGAAETSVADPLGEDFCGFGTHLICLPFNWHDGVMAPLPTLGGNNGEAFQINNRGQVVGEAENTTRDATCGPAQVLQFKPVIWEEGKIQDLPTFPGDPDGLAVAINDHGQAVGGSNDCTFLSDHALLWQNGTLTDLGNLGGLRLAPSDINNKAQVVGVAFVFNGPNVEAFVWHEGVVRGLGTLPGDVSSSGIAINDRSQLVGQSCADQNCGSGRAFLWEDGVMTDLNALISHSSSLQLFAALDINSRGEIVGVAVEKSTGQLHGFLAVPCGEERSEGCAEAASTTPSEIPSRSGARLPEVAEKLLRQRLTRARFGAKRQ